MVATTASAAGARAESRYFYVWMAVAYIVVAFGGFTPTYWAPLATHHFQGPPIMHIHGILLSSWVLFYFAQTYLVATRRVMDHRTWGLAGIALFTLVMCSILLTQYAVLKQDDALGFGDAARRFAAVPLCGVPLMITLFSLAITYVRQPERHKRYMVLLMSSMMTPAIARVFLAVLFHGGGADAGGPPPPFVTIPPGLIADLFVIVALVRDWRLRGKPHSIYVVGLLAVLAEQVLAVKIASTATWMGVVTAFQGLVG